MSFRKKAIGEAQHYSITSPHPLWLRATITAANSFILTDRQRNRLQKEIWRTGHRNQYINLQALGRCYEGTFVSQTALAQHMRPPVSSLGTGLGSLRVLLPAVSPHYTDSSNSYFRSAVPMAGKGKFKRNQYDAAGLTHELPFNGPFKKEQIHRWWPKSIKCTVVLKKTEIHCWWPRNIGKSGNRESLWPLSGASKPATYFQK